jgi:hypothetical protein
MTKLNRLIHMCSRIRSSEIQRRRKNLSNLGTRAGSEWANLPFEYSAPNERRAKVAYVMALQGLRLEGLHARLSRTPSQPMVCMVINGRKKSAPLERRIATVLGLSREELFGTKSLQLWGAA